LPKRFDPLVFLANIGEGKTITSYKSGDAIVTQGASAEHVLYLISGRLKETVKSDSGREAVIGLVEPGQFFGASAVNDSAIRLSSVAAVAPSVVTAMTKSAMRDAMRKPAFMQLFIAGLLRRNDQIEGEKVDLLFHSSEQRLAQKLLALAHFDGNGRADEISHVTQEMLADMIGTTRPRVNYFLKRFQKMGLIKKNGGGITVMSKLLAAILQQEDKK
jgi:CRP/FNR family cyclic AMP-dependent transcriptional regulator